MTDTDQPDNGTGEMSTRPPGQDTRWWTIKEAADAYNVSTKTVRRRIKAGKIVAQRDTDDPRSVWMLREDSLIAQFGTPDNEPTVQPAEAAAPTALVLKALLDDQREMIHELQRAHQAEAVAQAKAEHLWERVTEYKDERDDLRIERDRLVEQVANLSHRRWWQRKKAT